MCKLFIVGNGFDLASGLPTSYSDFRDYMRCKYNPTDEFADILPENEFGGNITVYDEEKCGRFLYHLINNSCTADNWSDFENSLANLDFHYALENWCIGKVRKNEEIDGTLPEMSNWNKIRNLDLFYFNLEKVVDYLHDSFSDWIETIDLNKGHAIPIFNEIIDDDCKFLTFNYTSTLENIYDIQSSRICHIHCFNENFIFGHGDQTNHQRVYNESYNEPKAAEVFNKITDSLRKNTRCYLNHHDNFFRNLSNVTEIYSYGFSFSDVDLPYIRRICEVVDTRNARWYQYRYNGSDYREIIEGCGFEGSIENW